MTVSVHVPAEAELVIEGHVLPDKLESEGPFAEFDGTYEQGQSYVFEVSANTARKEFIYQGPFSGSQEQLNLMGLANEAVILMTARAAVPGIRRVNVTLAGLRKFHVVAGLEKAHDGDGMDAIVAISCLHTGDRTAVTT